MKHFFTTKVKTVLIIAVLLAAGLAVISNLTGSTFADTLVQSVLSPLRMASYTASLSLSGSSKSLDSSSMVNSLSSKEMFL